MLSRSPECQWRTSGRMTWRERLFRLTMGWEGDVSPDQRVCRNITVEGVFVHVQLLVIVLAEEDFRVLPVSEDPRHAAVELLLSGGACVPVDLKV